MTIKRMTSFLLALLMVLNLCVPAYAAETTPALSLSVDKTEAVIGDTVTVTISCDTEITGLQTWGFDVYLDPDAYVLTEAVVNDGYDGMFGVATDTITEHSCVNVSAITTNTKFPLTIPQGEVATLTFTVVGESEGSFELKMVEAYIPDDDFSVTRLVGPAEGIQVVTKAEKEPEAPVDSSVTVTLSLSRDAEYMTGLDTGEVIAFKELTVPYFDLALYGLEDFYFVSETYGDDGDGLPGSDLEPGTAEYAEGKVTMLHLYLYALEKFYCGLEDAEIGKGYLAEAGLIGTEVFSISGGVGSAYLEQFWSGSCNLNYYVNYEYPLASDGWGATCDQILLKDGDMVTLGNFSGWDFYADPYSIFNYIVSDKSAVTQGEEVTLTLMFAGADMGMTGGTAQNLNTYCLDVYCVKVEELAYPDVTSWNYLGTSDENGQLVVDTTDLAPGEYIVAVAGQPGEYYPDEICSTPGGVLLTVNACDHNYVDGVCDKCSAADPNYVAPTPESNNYTVWTGVSMHESSTLDLYVSEWYIEDFKDVALASVVTYDSSNLGNTETYTYVDGDKVAANSEVKLGAVIEGDDKDTGLGSITNDTLTISSAKGGYGYKQMKVSPTDNYHITNYFYIYRVSTFALSDVTMQVNETSALTLSLDSWFDRWSTPNLMKCVEFSSSDPDVVTVAVEEVKDGPSTVLTPTLTAHKAGTAKITAKLGNKTASCEVTVAEPESKDLTIWTGELSYDRSSLDLYVTEWYVENGKDFVIAYFNDESQIPYGSMNSVLLVDGEQIKVGSKINLGYTVAGDDADQISSVTGNVATIPSYGYYMDMMRITQTDYYSLSNRFDIYPVNKFELADVTMYANEETTLNVSTNVQAYAFDKFKDQIVWTSSDESVLTVEGGKVTAKALGTATVTAKLGTLTASCEVTVESKNLTVWTGVLSYDRSSLDLYVTEWYVENGKDFVIAYFNDESQIPYGSMNSVLLVDGEQIKVGSKINLGYTVGGDDADQISSVTGNVATIPSYGYYMDMMRITQTDYYSLSNRFDIYPVNKFELADVQVEPGAETTLSVSTNVQAYAFDKFKDQIVWTSSNESVVTVEGGKIVAQEIGTATITAKLGTLSATCTVTVACEHDYFNGICTKCTEADPDYVAIETIQLTSPSMKTETDEATGETVSVLNLVAGGSEKLTAVLNAGATQGVIWTSENEGIATVNAEGVVTAISNGTTTITATAGDTAKTFAARNNPVLASVKVTVTGLPEGSYYTVTLGEDITVVAGETIEVPVTVGHSDYLNYNAWDMIFTYDSTSLELTTASSGDTFTVTADGNTIRVQGYGADMEADTAAFTLTFEAKKAATTELSLDSALVDNAGHAIGNDAPEAQVIDGLTVLTVTGYPVTLPEGFQGEGVAAPGKDYSFSAPEDYYDYTVEIQVGGETVTVESVDGTWTIPGEDVTGEIVITETDKTGKTFDVVLGDYMSGEPTAQHGADYTATLNKEAGYTYAVSVKIGGEAYTGAQITGNTYVIRGADITGKIEFVVTRDVVASTDLKVEFTGSGAGAADGNATTVKNGEDYVLTLTEAKGYTYTVKVNGKTVEPTDGKYIVKNVSTNLTIEIERTLELEGKVSVNEYVNLDGKTVFLVLVDGELDEGNCYTYNGKAMYYSFVYEAWATLTVESGSFAAADATAKVDAAAGSKMTISSANGDVNNTGTVDINDAQLAYDVYKGNYGEIADIGMAKYLWADVNGDTKVDVADAQSVIAAIK